jgi:hypothetical protein
LYKDLYASEALNIYRSEKLVSKEDVEKECIPFVVRRTYLS